MTTQNRRKQDLRRGRWTKQRSYCNCCPHIREQTATYSIGGIKLFKTLAESRKHSVTCPLYIGTEAVTTVGLKMTYYGRLVASTIRASMLITVGAGGRSISPCLNFRAQVPNDSPAFSILSRYNDLWYLSSGDALPSRNEVSEFFESALQQLYELFKNKEASPADINEFGETLVHVLRAPNSK